MPSTELKDISEIAQQSHVCTDIKQDCEALSLHSFTSGNADTSSTFFIQQVCVDFNSSKEIMLLGNYF